MRSIPLRHTDGLATLPFLLLTNLLVTKSTPLWGVDGLATLPFLLVVWTIPSRHTNGLPTRPLLLLKAESFQPGHFCCSRHKDLLHTVWPLLHKKTPCTMSCTLQNTMIQNRINDSSFIQMHKIVCVHQQSMSVRRHITIAGGASSAKVHHPKAELPCIAWLPSNVTMLPDRQKHNRGNCFHTSAEAFHANLAPATPPPVLHKFLLFSPSSCITFLHTHTLRHTHTQ